MTKTIKLLLLFLLIGAGQLTYAQDNKDKAYEKGIQALKLEDEGRYDEAITLLKEAQKLDKESIQYPYEIAYAYYKKEDYKKAIKIIEGIIERKDASDLYYQLLGNAYDNIKKPDKAIKIYKEGIDRFPNSGKLYLECGIVELFRENYDKAINYWENGVKVDPSYPSNYYWLGKVFCSSTEEVWGMIYGEIFMNLERNTKRTSEMSKLLYKTYKSEIKFTSDTSYTVSFCKNSTINIDDLSDISKIKLPFGLLVYEPILMMSLVNEKSINLNSLDRVRQKFVEAYFKNADDQTYPNVLFDFQNKILQEGHLEAYNHWILMEGDEDTFDEWQSANKEKWDNFVDWFQENSIEIDQDHKFVRSQY